MWIHEESKKIINDFDSYPSRTFISSMVELGYMGKVIGSVESNCTTGEGRVFDYLNEIFEDDPQTWCYHEPFIGDTKPDFLLLKPDVGVVIFDVKDYHEVNLAAVTASGPFERTDGTMMENPFDQMYHYWQVIQAGWTSYPSGAG